MPKSVLKFKFPDEIHNSHPELIKDAYWDSVLVTELPYTVAAANIRDEPPVSSTANIEVKNKGAEIIQATPSAVRIDEMVGKQSHATDYQFPDNNDNESDKAEVRYSIHFNHWLNLLNNELSGKILFNFLNFFLFGDGIFQHFQQIHKL